MEKKLIAEIVKKATLRHVPHIHPRTVKDLEETLIETLYQTLNTSNVSICPCCGSDDLFKFKLEHIKCKSCNTRFEHSC